MLLSHLDLEFDDFICTNHTTVDEHILVNEAMTALIKLMSNLLAPPEREYTITRLSLRFCLFIDWMTSVDYLCDIRNLVCNAIDSGKVKSVEFEIVTEKCSLDYDTEDMLVNAKILVCFFDTSPSLSRCLTKLSLYSARFSEPEMHRLLISCEQLQHLILTKCETWDESILRVDMPTSKLCLLELHWCDFERVELLCLPKLVQLHCESWTCLNAPLSFDLVPCLEELRLVCAATCVQPGFKLTDLLRDTANIQALTLDFQGEKIWITPEGKELCTPFNKLSKLFLHGVYVEFDLLWTLILLEAAPLAKIFGVKVWKHACDEDTDSRRTYSERTNDSWDAKKFDGATRFLQLKELEFGGFKPVKEHLDFIRVVMECAPNLEAVVLEDRETCEDCEALDTPTCSSIQSLFPKNKDEKDIIVERLRDGTSRHVQVIFR